MTHTMARKFNPKDLKPEERLIILLLERGVLSIDDLAERSGLARKNVIKIVRYLIELGIIEDKSVLGLYDDSPK